IVDRVDGKGARMFHAIESLFGGRRDYLAIYNEGRGGILSLGNPVLPLIKPGQGPPFEWHCVLKATDAKYFHNVSGLSVESDGRPKDRACHRSGPPDGAVAMVFDRVRQL